MYLNKIKKYNKFFYFYNKTGAEIEAVVKSASSFAFNRFTNIMNFN